MEKFIKLGLSKDVTKVLEYLEFDEPTEIQKKTIPLALAGEDIIGGSATGSGKTLAFASGIVESVKPNKGVQALILTPTRELAKQVARSIRQFGENKMLNVLAIYGGVSIGPQIKKLLSTEVVVGTPGRLLDHMKRRTLRLDNINTLVLDEVDRMFDMGFHKDVESIIQKCPKERQTMLFSATISSEINYLSKKYTTDAKEVEVKSYIDASKLEQVFYDTPGKLKFSLLVHLLKKEKSNLAIVFCSTRRNVDFIAKNLAKEGIHAKAIHGGMNQRKRTKILKEFHKKGLKVLVGTDVAARGLDIDDVSHVYNYDVPSGSKGYIHRIGRTARAGKEGKAITILTSRDYENFREVLKDDSLNIVKADLPKVDLIKTIKTHSKSRRRRGRGRRGKKGKRRGRNSRNKSRRYNSKK